MHSTKPLLLIAAVLAMPACAAQQRPLTAAAAASLKGRRIATTTRSPTPFVVAPPGKDHPNMYGAVGALAAAESMADAGGRILREDGIADPAAQMAAQLRDELTRRYGMKVDPRSLYMAGDDPTQVIAAHPEADLLLDVRVGSLSLGPLVHDSAKYGLAYSVYVRLIDAKVVHAIDGSRGEVIADGGCSRKPQATPTSPTYDEFLADKAQRLKHELDLATRFCVQEFRMKVLTPDGTPSPPQERP